MGAIAVTMGLGIGIQAHLFDVRVTEGTLDTYGTVLSQIGRGVFGTGAGFITLQVATMAILVLGANTAYQDFPRLSAILAAHRLMPRQFRNRGDRLVFSNGIVVVAVLAGLLIVAFGAQVSRLIQLYVVGVFTSFTFSQTGMVLHWLRFREKGWQRSVVFNAVGAVVDRRGAGGRGHRQVHPRRLDRHGGGPAVRGGDGGDAPPLPVGGLPAAPGPRDRR